MTTQLFADDVFTNGLSAPTRNASRACSRYGTLYYSSAQTSVQLAVDFVSRQCLNITQQTGNTLYMYPYGTDSGNLANTVFTQMANAVGMFLYLDLLTPIAVNHPTLALGFFSSNTIDYWNLSIAPVSGGAGHLPAITWVNNNYHGGTQAWILKGRAFPTSTGTGLLSYRTEFCVFVRRSLNGVNYAGTTYGTGWYLVEVWIKGTAQSNEHSAVWTPYGVFPSYFPSQNGGAAHYGYVPYLKATFTSFDQDASNNNYLYISRIAMGIDGDGSLGFDPAYQSDVKRRIITKAWTKAKVKPLTLLTAECGALGMDVIHADAADYALCCNGMAESVWDSHLELHKSTDAEHVVWNEQLFDGGHIFDAIPTDMFKIEYSGSGTATVRIQSVSGGQGTAWSDAVEYPAGWVVNNGGYLYYNAMSHSDGVNLNHAPTGSATSNAYWTYMRAMPATWDSGTSYSSGQVVFWKGVDYSAVQNVSSGGDSPDLDTTNTNWLPQSRGLHCLIINETGANAGCYVVPINAFGVGLSLDHDVRLSDISAAVTLATGGNRYTVTPDPGIAAGDRNGIMLNWCPEFDDTAIGEDGVTIQYNQYPVCGVIKDAPDGRMIVVCARYNCMVTAGVVRRFLYSMRTYDPTAETPWSDEIDLTNLWVPDEDGGQHNGTDTTEPTSRSPLGMIRAASGEWIIISDSVGTARLVRFQETTGHLLPTDVNDWSVMDHDWSNVTDVDEDSLCELNDGTLVFASRAITNTHVSYLCYLTPTERAKASGGEWQQITCDGATSDGVTLTAGHTDYLGAFNSPLAVFSVGGYLFVVCNRKALREVLQLWRSTEKITADNIATIRFKKHRGSPIGHQVGGGDPHGCMTYPQASTARNKAHLAVVASQRSNLYWFYDPDLFRAELPVSSAGLVDTGD